MADAETWTSRISEWKASGLTSGEFCEGKPYSAGGLRHMAYRLGKGRAARVVEPQIRLAKVLVGRREAAPSSGTAAPKEATGVQSEPKGGAEALAIECGSMRVLVRSGFDRGTLAAVLDVLAARGGPR